MIFLGQYKKFRKWTSTCLKSMTSRATPSLSMRLRAKGSPSAACSVESKTWSTSRRSGQTHFNFRTSLSKWETLSTRWPKVSFTKSTKKAWSWRSKLMRMSLKRFCQTPRDSARSYPTFFGTQSSTLKRDTSTSMSRLTRFSRTIRQASTTKYGNASRYLSGTPAEVLS